MHTYTRFCRSQTLFRLHNWGNYMYLKIQWIFYRPVDIVALNHCTSAMFALYSSLRRRLKYQLALEPKGRNRAGAKRSYINTLLHIISGMPEITGQSVEPSRKRTSTETPQYTTLVCIRKVLGLVSSHTHYIRTKCSRKEKLLRLDYQPAP